MYRSWNLIGTTWLLLLLPTQVWGDNVLFADDFKNGLSPKWEVVGLQKSDYRIKDGGLEMRVLPGKLTTDTPMLKVNLPFTSGDTVIATVDLTILDEWTRDGEFAGLYLIDDGSREFRATQERIDGKRVYTPGKYRFAGNPGEEGDPKKFTVEYIAVAKADGPLRIIVDRGNAFFQVGPSKENRYLNFFHSAIRKTSKSRGFGLTTAGAPEGVSHWVRFSNFRVTKE